jgi:hypothetical protein
MLKKIFDFPAPTIHILQIILILLLTLLCIYTGYLSHKLNCIYSNLQNQYLRNLHQQKILERKLQELKKPDNLKTIAERMNLQRGGEQHERDN